LRFLKILLLATGTAVLVAPVFQRAFTPVARHYIGGSWLPTMREYPQRIVLVEKADSLAWVPVQPGRVAVLALTQEGRIQKISHWNPDSEPVAGCLQ
jgi:hypothetical protein